MGLQEIEKAKLSDNRIWGVRFFSSPVKFACGHLADRGRKNLSLCFECVVAEGKIRDSENGGLKNVRFCSSCLAEAGKVVRVPPGDDTCEKCQQEISERIRNYVPLAANEDAGHGMRDARV